MAWQEPKTNWGAADSVRDTDFNRIEGNILDLHNRTAREAVTIYVATTGNDSTGDGSSATPYRTIAKALAMAPKNANGKAVSIYLNAGTYNEDVVVAGFTGLIAFTGRYNTDVVLSSLTIDGCAFRCTTIGLYVGGTSSGITVTNGGTAIFEAAVDVANSTTGVSVLRGSNCIVKSALRVIGATTQSIQVSESSRFYALSITANDAQSVILCEQGSVAAYASSSSVVSGVAVITRNGGRVYTGAQTNLGNY